MIGDGIHPVYGTIKTIDRAGSGGRGRAEEVSRKALARVNGSETCDAGLSSILGTILLVVVTVALAGVIGAFVFHIVGNVRPNKQVAIDVRVAAPGTIQIKVLSGEDVLLLTQDSATAPCFKVLVDGVEAPTSDVPGQPGTRVYAGPGFGTAQYFTVPSGSDLTVVACFQEGSEYAVWAGAAP